MAAFPLTPSQRLWERSNPRAIPATKKEEHFAFKKIKFDFDTENGEIDFENDFSNDTLVDDAFTRILEKNGLNDPVNETLTFRSSEIPRLNVPLPPTHESGLFSSVSETLKDISQRISGRNENILLSFNNYIFDEAAKERFYSFKNSVSKPEDHSIFCQ